MKKQILLAVILLITAVFLLGGCNASRQTEIVVFAASSMTETLTELGKKFEEEYPEVSLVFSFESSGTLKTQIAEGAICDIFISAGQKQMDQLEEAQEIMAGSRMDLLENKVVLVVPEGNPKGIGSFADMKSGLEKGNILLAIGNADVPVGQYTEQILEFWKVDMKAAQAAGCVTYGSHVKEVTAQIAEGVADCGIIYATDAYVTKLTVVDAADSAMCGQVIYPAAIMKRAEAVKEAEEFLEFLTGETAEKIFVAAGFTPVH